MEIARAIGGARVYFDANIVIYLLEGFKAYQPQIDWLASAIASHLFQPFTGEITIMETLVGPFRSNNHRAASSYREFVETSGTFGLIATTREIYAKAALFRAEFNLRAQDAVHVASAAKAECKFFLTNDKSVRLPYGIQLIGLHAII